MRACDGKNCRNVRWGPLCGIEGPRCFPVVQTRRFLKTKNILRGMNGMFCDCSNDFCMHVASLVTPSLTVLVSLISSTSS